MAVTARRTAAHVARQQQPRLKFQGVKYLIKHFYGDEDQNDLMNMIDEGEDEPMETSKIKELMNEVEIYKQAIQDAKDALASAEQELDETLDEEFKQ